MRNVLEILRGLIHRFLRSRAQPHLATSPYTFYRTASSLRLYAGPNVDVNVGGKELIQLSM